MEPAFCLSFSGHFLTKSGLSSRHSREARIKCDREQWNEFHISLANVEVEATDTAGYHNASHTKICHNETQKSLGTFDAVSGRPPTPCWPWLITDLRENWIVAIPKNISDALP